jgi:hypothetical protein
MKPKKKPAKELANPLVDPEVWTFRRAPDGASVDVLSRTWFAARAEAASKLGCVADDLVCFHNPCLPPIEVPDLLPVLNGGDADHTTARGVAPALDGADASARNSSER